MNDKWIQFNKDWFNLADFCHIWIETRFDYDYSAENNHKKCGYYAMGEWRHSGEEVIITQDWDSFEQLRNYLNEKLGLGWTRNENP